jgi:hypothetical protein
MGCSWSFAGRFFEQDRLVVASPLTQVKQEVAAVQVSTIHFRLPEPMANPPPEDEDGAWKM